VEAMALETLRGTGLAIQYVEMGWLRVMRCVMMEMITPTMDVTAVKKSGNVETA
jgi:hypothetical protein